MEGEFAAGAVGPVAQDRGGHVRHPDRAEFAIGMAMGKGNRLPCAARLGDLDLAAKLIGVGHQQARLVAMDLDRRMAVLGHVETHRDRDHSSVVELQCARDMGVDLDGDQRALHRRAGDEPLGARPRRRTHYPCHRPEQLHEIGDVIRPHVEHGSAAAQIVEARRRMPALMAGAAEKGAARHRLADRSVVNQLACRLVASAEEGVRGAADTQALLGRELHDLAGLDGVDAERLLGMDMLASVEDREADIGMGQRHREIDHNLDIVALEQLVDAQARRTEFGAALLGCGTAHIRDGLELDHWEVLERLQIFRADVAAANDAYPDLAHARLHRCCPMSVH